MFPHGRSLVEKYKDAPFALVGVNGDESEIEVKRLLDEGDVTWRSFRNGGPHGPITETWGVTAWPSFFVLDAVGVIRFRHVRGEELDRAIEQLLAEI